jgi:hypothetical protein
LASRPLGTPRKPVCRFEHFVWNRDCRFHTASITTNHTASKASKALCPSACREILVVFIGLSKVEVDTRSIYKSCGNSNSSRVCVGRHGGTSDPDGERGRHDERGTYE